MGQSNSIMELVEEILPTPVQAVVAFFVSLAWMVMLQRHALTEHFTGGDSLPPIASHTVNLQVAHFLGLQIVGQAAIIVFWSVVGLAAYLVVWWVNNLVIGARNQVIIKTSYANQARSGAAILVPVLRLVFIAGLIASVATIPYGLNAWLSLWQELLNTNFGLKGIALALAAVTGFAAELYLSFVLFQFVANRFRS